jgi:ATP-binding cassette, subfamily C (CFTR/MRP), member 1
VKRDWHFWAKLSILGLILADTVVQAVLQTQQLADVWYEDFRFWSTIINLVSLVVISYVQYVEHWRSRVSNGVVLTYWLFLICVYGVKLRSLVSQELHKQYLPYFVTFAIGLGLSVVEFVLEWLVPKRVSAYDALGDEDECPIEYASIFSILTFSWMTPMMKYGYKEFLTQDDLWNLRSRDTTRSTSAIFDEVWEEQLEKTGPVRRSSLLSRVPPSLWQCSRCPSDKLLVSISTFSVPSRLGCA